MKPEQYVQVDGLELAVYRWGEKQADKPRVLLLHGYPDSAMVWQECAELLALDFEVIAYDVRGAGASSRPTEVSAYTLEKLAGDMSAVIQAVSPDKPVHLMAHDWGSIQSWEAVCDAQISQQIASFSSISGPSLDHMGHWLKKRLLSTSASQKATVLKQLMSSWYIGLFHLPVLAPSLWKWAGADLWPRALQVAEGINDAQANPNQSKDGLFGINLYRANVMSRVLKPQARRCELPTQLIFPKNDHFMIKEIWEELPNWVPQLWRSEVEAGHWVPLSDPALLADKLRSFINLIEQGNNSPALQRAQQSAKRMALGPTKPQDGKLVVVTGAGSGFGRETALLFAEMGADIVAVDINAQAAKRTAELCRLLHVSAWDKTVDVSDKTQMSELAHWVETNFVSADVVINNAGIGMAGSFFDTSDEDWDTVLGINLGGVILGSRLFGQQMKAAGVKGHIVNVASMGAYTPSRFMSAYNTSKAAVRMLSDCLRAELAEQNIHVSTICPGLSITNITSSTRFVGSDAQEQARQQRDTTKLYQKRNLQPTAIAKAIYQAVNKKQAEVPVGIEAHSTRWLSRLAPPIARRMAKVNIAP